MWFTRILDKMSGAIFGNTIFNKTPKGSVSLWNVKTCKNVITMNPDFDKYDACSACQSISGV